VSTLFEMDDFQETRTEWRLVPDWHLCGMCGTKTNWNQGGTNVGGAICDGCAQLDRCEDRGDRHVSHWGISHRPEEHDELLAAQTHRRASYLSRLKGRAA
jgi:hypothetical protein